MEKEVNKILNEFNTKVIINNVLVNKLDSILMDIKYYMNTNVNIGQSVDDTNSSTPFMSNDDIDELFSIRKRIKLLNHKLKAKL